MPHSLNPRPGTVFAPLQGRPAAAPALLAEAVIFVCASLLLYAALTGCGSGQSPVASTGVPLASLSATSVAFGTVTVGTTVSQQVTLSNPGTGPMASLSFALGDTTDFSLANPCGGTLAAGASCTLTVTFKPASTGALGTTLSVHDDAAGSPQTVLLSGTGAAVPLPQASLSPSSLLFSAFVGGSAAVSQTATLTNTGSAPLLLSSITLSDTTNYSLSTTCGQTLAAGASCTLAAGFQPQERGTLAATITLSDNAGQAANAGGAANSMQTVMLSGTGQPPVSSVMNFGDSITCGYYALPNDGTGYVYSTEGYAGLLDAAIGKPAQNLCRAGDQAVDMNRLWVYPNAKPQLGGHQLYTVLIGTNDANSCGSSPGCLANWSSALTASLAWLALPASDKTLGAGIANKSGNWAADPDGLGIAATGPGNTLSFPVIQAVAGRTLYLGYRVYDAAPGSTGSASVMLDGMQVADLEEIASTGHALHTQNGTSDAVFVTAIALGAVGQHTVSLTTTSAAGAPFTFVWAGVSTGNYAAAVNGPRVILGGVTAATPALLQANIAAYNALLPTLVGQLTADGMDVEIAPTASALDPLTDLTDIVHPNNAGHAKLTAAFRGVL